MLRSIRLRNFRSLRDTGLVELRPIVLLVGANSSGKSSFLRFFPLLKQTYWANSTGSPLLWYLDNSDVDFGDFDNALFQGADDPWIEVSAELSGSPAPLHFTSCIAGAEGRSYIRHFSVSDAENTANLSIAPDANVHQIETADFRLTGAATRLAQRLGGPIPRLEGSEPAEFASDKLRELLHTHTDLGPEDLERLAHAVTHGPPEDLQMRLQRVRGEKALRDAAARLSASSEVVGTLKQLVFLRRLDRTLDHLTDAVREHARGIRYIGPFRRSPQRFYRRTEYNIAEIERDGSNLAMFLDALSAADREVFSEWLRRHFGFGVHTERRGAHVAMLVDTDSRRRFNVMDMGFGLSQLLPVVAQCWLASGQLRDNQLSLFRDPNRSILPGTAPTLIAIEQPELHLHPHHQAQLADMFHSTVQAMDQIGQPVSLCVETHSEAMLYRFGELVESGALRREDISILMFEKVPGVDESSVRPIEFGANGVLQDWPIGFFRG